MSATHLDDILRNVFFQKFQNLLFFRQRIHDLQNISKSGINIEHIKADLIHKNSVSKSACQVSCVMKEVGVLVCDRGVILGRP